MPVYGNHHVPQAPILHSHLLIICSVWACVCMWSGGWVGELGWVLLTWKSWLYFEFLLQMRLRVRDTFHYMDYQNFHPATTWSEKCYCAKFHMVFLQSSVVYTQINNWIGIKILVTKPNIILMWVIVFFYYVLFFLFCLANRNQS